MEKRQIRGKEKEELLDRIKKLSMLKKREREREWGLKAFEGATLILALFYIVPTIVLKLSPKLIIYYVCISR